MKDNNVKNVKRWETEQVAIQSVVEESNSANNSGTIDHSRNTITYHNTLCLSHQILHKHCLQFLSGVKMAPRETENNAYAKFGVTNKEHYGMLWHFLEWSILFLL